MNKKFLLILGDVVAVAILTVIGFATHGEADTTYLPRMAAVFFPTLIAWFLLAPQLGLFDLQVISDWKNLWRVVSVAIFAAPLALVLRSLILNVPIIPIFAVVFAATNALGFLVWRAIYKLVSPGNR